MSLHLWAWQREQCPLQKPWQSSIHPAWYGTAVRCPSSALQILGNSGSPPSASCHITSTLQVSELHCLRVRRINPYEMCRAPPDPSAATAKPPLCLKCKCCSVSCQHMHGMVTTIQVQQSNVLLCAAGLSQRIAALRTKAIDVLAVPLGGDRLAAEYLLLQLVSR